MIRHIKYIVISLLLFFSCKQNKAFEKKQQDKSVIANQVVKEIVEQFTFFKSFQFCDNSYAAYTQDEANKIYLKKKILFNRKEKGESLVWNSFFYEGAKQCVEKELEEKVNSSFLYSLNEDFPFDKILLFNKEYLITAQDGYFFVFKTQSLSNESLDKLQNQQGVEKKILKKIYNKSKLIHLPYNYSYEEITNLPDYTSFDLILPSFSNLDGLMIAKLNFNNDSKLLLLSGSQESGEDQLYLLSLNHNYEIIDELLLCESREIEEGSMLTTYKINKNHIINIIKEEIIGRNKKILETKSYKITKEGKIVEIQ